MENTNKKVAVIGTRGSEILVDANQTRRGIMSIGDIEIPIIDSWKNSLFRPETRRERRAKQRKRR
jgi:hypothetical protein